MNARQRRLLRRYLDVTKAQLLFAKAILLVEGISEALLIPELARAIGIEIEDHAVSVVNIQSLAFEPFMRLFQEGAIKIRAAVISDGDRNKGVPRDEAEISATARRLQELESGELKTFLADYTFEYDLALAGNAARMATVYETLRTQKGATMITEVTEAEGNEEKARAFWPNFDLKDKAEFAQVLAEAIADDSTDFVVPQYIRSALSHVVGGDDAGGE